MDVDLETDLFHSAQRLALDPTMLGFDPAEVNPDARGRQLRSATLLAGVLWDSSTRLIDDLLVDVEDLRATPDRGAWPQLVVHSAVLSELPARFHPRITPAVAAKFLVVAVDLTSRFSQGWRPLSCVAQALMLRCLLNDAEAFIDNHDLSDITAHWRAGLEDQLFEDPDHELLYQPGMDDFEDHTLYPATLRMAPLAFNRWFVPFVASRRLPPYAEDEPSVRSAR